MFSTTVHIKEQGPTNSDAAQSTNGSAKHN